MLDLLIDYAKTHNLTIEPGFKPKTIRWAIVCDESGRFLNVQELGNPGDKRNRGRTFEVCPDLSLPEMKAGGSGCRHFLVDNVEVVALLGKNGDVLLDSDVSKKQKQKAKAKHDYFVSLLRKATTTMEELAGLAAVLDSSESLTRIQQAFSNQRFKPTDYTTFAVVGRTPMYLLEDDGWHEWWREFRQSLSAKKSTDKTVTGTTMRCFGSGTLSNPSLIHPKIEGLSDVGGLSMGDALTSFKQESFCSYFLSQSRNAALSAEMAAAYRGGLNSLIAHHSQKLTSTKVVHWYAGKDEVPDELDPLNWLVAHEETETTERVAQAKARSLLDSIRTGKYERLLDYRYYSITLSGASGRVMIRDWIEGRFGELAANIDAWFEDFAIVRHDGHRLAPHPKLLAVFGGLVRDLSDLPPPMAARLWRVAIRNENIPEFAMAKAFARTKVDIIKDEPMSHARMGLLKAYHMRKGDKNMNPYLNEEHPNPAYHCGRLMAVYADLQYAALPGVGAGVVQRYYAAASATPALIFGRLARGAQFHLNKLEGGLAHWYEQRLACIWARLQQDPPATLTLEEQSLFAMGYYQQKAHDMPKQTDESKTDDSKEINNV